MTSQAFSGRDNRGWRYRCGVALFALTIALGLAVPVSAAIGVPVGTVAIAGGVVFVANKVILVLAIAVMGKTGFQDLKQMLRGYLPSMTSDEMVGPARHAIGLLMLCAPIVLAWLSPYIDAVWPALGSTCWQVQLVADVVMAAGIFVLGGNFWDKVRALFVREARVADIGSLPAAA